MCVVSLWAGAFSMSGGLMPRLRLLADTAIAQASGISGQDVDGNFVFDVGAGDLTAVSIDATGWAGGGAVSTSEWSSPDGLTLSSRTLASPVASCNAYVPDDGTPPIGRTYRLRNTLTLAAGPIRNTTIWLRAMGR